MSGNDDSTPLGEAVAAGERYTVLSARCAGGGSARLACLRSAASRGGGGHAWDVFGDATAVTPL